MKRHSDGSPVTPDGGKWVPYDDFPDGAIGLLVLLLDMDTDSLWLGFLVSGSRADRSIKYTYQHGPKAGKTFVNGYCIGARVAAFPTSCRKALFTHVREYNKWWRNRYGKRVAA